MVSSNSSIFIFSNESLLKPLGKQNSESLNNVLLLTTVFSSISYILLIFIPYEWVKCFGIDAIFRGPSK